MVVYLTVRSTCFSRSRADKPVSSAATNNSVFFSLGGMAVEGRGMAVEGRGMEVEGRDMAVEGRGLPAATRSGSVGVSKMSTTFSV